MGQERLSVKSSGIQVQEIDGTVNQDEEQSINDWIIQDPERAKRAASSLLRPYLAQVFIARVGGATPFEISQKTGIKRTSVNSNTSEARRQLAAIYDLTSGLERKGDVFRKLQLKRLFDQSHQRDKSATLRIIAFWPGILNSHLRQISSERKTAYLAKVIEKVDQDMQRISWQGVEALKHRVSNILFNARVSEYRRQISVAKSKEQKRPLSGPLDLISQWLDNHRVEAEKLIEALPEWQRKVFLAKWKMGLSIKEIREIFHERSEQSIKVAMHHANNFLVKETGVLPPKGYQPIKHFVPQGVSYNKITKAIREGKVKGAIVFRRQLFLTQEIFEAHFGQKIPIKEIPLPQAPETPIEAALLNQAKENDQEDLRVIFQTYYPKVYHYCLAETGNEQETVTLADLVFEKIATGLDQYQNQKKPSFTIWFFSISYHTVEDYKRKHRPKTVNAGERKINQLIEAIKVLPHDERKIIILESAAGLSLSETAQVLGKTEDAIKIARLDALERLHKILKQPEESAA